MAAHSIKYDYLYSACGFAANIVFIIFPLISFINMEYSIHLILLHVIKSEYVYFIGYYVSSFHREHVRKRLYCSPF